MTHIDDSTTHQRLRGKRIIMLVDNPCDPDPRVTREAQLFAEAGAEVLIYAWQREGASPKREHRDGVSIERLGPSTTRHLGWRQLAYLARFCSNAWRVASKQRADVVVAHDLLVLPLGAALARKLDAHLVYDAHEVYRWMDAGRLPDAWLRAAARTESWLIDHRVDLFVTVSRQRVEEYWRKHVRRQALVVGNWYNPETVDVEGTRARFELHSDGPLIGYAGALSPARRLDLLVELARTRPDVHVVVAGRGTTTVVNMLERADRELPNLRYLGWIDPAIELLGACDAIYYGMDPSIPYCRFAAPNTLYMAIAVDRPLLSFAGGEVAMLAREGRGVVSMGAPTLNALTRAVDQLPNHLGWGSTREEYTWTVAASRYLRAMEALTTDHHTD